jgi:hypothetical protein
MKGLLIPVLVISALVNIGIFLGVKIQGHFHSRLANDYCFSHFEKTVDTNKCLSDLGAK